MLFWKVLLRPWFEVNRRLVDLFVQVQQFSVISFEKRFIFYHAGSNTYFLFASLGNLCEFFGLLSPFWSVILWAACACSEAREIKKKVVGVKFWHHYNILTSQYLHPQRLLYHSSCQRKRFLRHQMPNDNQVQKSQGHLDASMSSSSALYRSLCQRKRCLCHQMPIDIQVQNDIQTRVTRPRWTEWGLLFYLNLSFYYPCSKSARACNIRSVSNFIWTLHFILIGWFSNRTGTSVDDGKARGKD